MKTETGGPAFPEVAYKQPEGGGGHIMTICGGMTMRDYFAAKAMTIHLSRQTRPWEDYNYRNAARQAYQMADAMLAARKQEKADAAE